MKTLIIISLLLLAGCAQTPEAIQARQNFFNAMAAYGAMRAAQPPLQWQPVQIPDRPRQTYGTIYTPSGPVMWDSTTY